MHFFAALLIILAIGTSAIDMVLFEDNDCDTDEDDAHSCIDMDYNECCGSFTTAKPDEPVTGVLFGAAAVRMGTTEILNTPVLRAYNQGGEPVSICSQIRASWPYVDNPDRTFPCGAAAAPNSYNGYNVVSIVTTKQDGHLGETAGKMVEPNAFGAFENGTIYAIRRDSELGSLYKELRVKMTAKERRSFVIMYTEIEERSDAKVFRA
jgi:hypothetical protein